MNKNFWTVQKVLLALIIGSGWLIVAGAFEKIYHSPLANMLLIPGMIVSLLCSIALIVYPILRK